MKPEMTQLEWDSAQETIRKIHNAESVEELRHFILEEFPAKIDCHSATWNAHDGMMNIVEMAGTEFIEKDYAHLKGVVERNVPNHPLFHHVFIDKRVVGWGYPKSILGVTEQEEFRKSPIYLQAYKEMKIEDQVCSQILYREQGGLILSFNSSQTIRSQVIDYIAVIQTHLELKGDQLLDVKRKAKSEQSIKVESLTQRETEVASWLVLGKTNEEISIILGVSKRTVDKHIENIFTKLELDSRWQVMSHYGAFFAKAQL